MAIYHLSASIISRAKGRSSTAASAYRAAERIVDERTGEIHDYTRKGGVVSADIVLPVSHPEWALDRSQLWNAVELKNKRVNSQVARDITIALPKELSAEQRHDLAISFAQDIAEQYQLAIDVAVHAPHGNNDNHHAHLLMSTNTLTVDGFGNKCRAFDNIAAKKSGQTNAIEVIREQWAERANQALATSGYEERIDHRSLEAQGVDRMAQIHLGPTATAMERRGIQTDLGNKNREILQLKPLHELLMKIMQVLGELSKGLAPRYALDGAGGSVLEQAVRRQGDRAQVSKDQQIALKKASDEKYQQSRRRVRKRDKDKDMDYE